MSMNARKLARYLGELESIYQQSVNLTFNYENVLILINQVRSEPRPIGFDHNYINITETQLYTDHQNLMLELNALRVKLNSFNGRTLVDSDYMPMLVLGEELSNWSDNYTRSIVVSAINVVNHVQDTYAFYNQQQLQAGAINV